MPDAQTPGAATVYEYRLSWEMLVPGDTEWRRTERLAKSDDPFCDIEDQHATLRQWAETGEEPIRDVVLERRVVDDRWETVDAVA